MRTTKRRRPRFVRFSGLLLPDGAVVLYALSNAGEIWEKAPNTSWVCLSAGGGK